MLTIGLVIVNKSSNYGALLQSYATQQFIEQLGYNTEIIRCKEDHSLKGIIYNILKHCIPVVYRTSLKTIKKKNYLKRYKWLQKSDALRNEKGQIFVKEKLKNIVTFDSLKQLHLEVPVRYSAVLIGSDQQWTPQCFYNPINTLSFVPDDVNKISYATSTGVSYFPWYTLSRVNRYISRFQHVSVRENTGKAILQKVTRRMDIEVVPDPTILLTKSEWDKAIPVNKPIVEDYVFCYILANDGIAMEMAIKYAKEHHLKIIAVRNIEIFEKDHTDYGDAEVLEAPTVEEFVNYIRNARVVFTDSFHGTVFSILNHREFVTFYRYSINDINSRNSRIDDFLGALDLQGRIVSQGRRVSTILSSKIDYISVDEELSKIREKGQRFLKCALG